MKPLLTLAAVFACAFPTVAAPTGRVKIYVVALGDNGKIGKKIGCGDSLVSVSRFITPTSAPLTGAIRQLLKEPHNSQSLPHLGNYWVGPGLKLKSVSVKGGLAAIRFTGHVAVAGVCDEPRIEEQIEATARQFPTVKRVQVWVGNEKLADAIR